MINKEAIFLSLLEKCKSLKQLKQLHAVMITTTLTSSLIPLSRLVDLCIDLGNLGYARSIFLRISHPSLFICNSMLRALSASRNPASALAVYRDLQHAGLAPDHFTFPFALKACAAVLGHRSGRCVHARALKTGYEADVYVSTATLHMYVSCGDMRSARTLFDVVPNKNVVGWTTMIAGYAHHDRAEEAIRLFGEMELEGVSPNEITMVHLLTACGRSKDLETGKRLHARLHRMGTNVIQCNVVLATAFLDMYAKCGSLKPAQELFNKMPERNVVSWNTMICAYDQYGQCAEALQLFTEMRDSGLKPDEVTFLSLLGVCGDKGDLSLGQGIHAYIEKTYSCKDVAMGTALMNMYAKTGDTQSALQLFGGLERRDVLAWTSMIIGLAMHGHGKKALNLFGEMERDNVAPDDITFIGVMSACSNAGLIKEGRRHFHSMTRIYGITPSVEHYGCMVKLLSRAGHLEEAERLVRSMPVQPNIKIWSAILSGCEIHGEIDLADRIRKQLSEFDPWSGGVHVLLSNIYAGAGRWEGVQGVRQLMRRQRIEKTHGTSSIEVKVPCLLN